MNNSNGSKAQGRGRGFAAHCKTYCANRHSSKKSRRKADRIEKAAETKIRQTGKSECRDWC